jgi:hypothetical protein
MKPKKRPAQKKWKSKRLKVLSKIVGFIGELLDVLLLSTRPTFKF